MYEISFKLQCVNTKALTCWNIGKINHIFTRKYSVSSIYKFYICTV